MLWQRGPTTIRDVHRVLSADRTLAYTTVATIVGRLAKKRLLRRSSKTRKAHRYVPVVSEQDVIAAAVDEAFAKLLEHDMAPAIAALFRHKSRLTRRDIAALEKLVRQLRKR